MRFIETNTRGLMQAGFQSLTFPGGEPHIKLKEVIKDEDIFITARIMNWNEWGFLLALLETLSFPGAHNRLHLFIPYFPGARQDKPDDHLSPLTCQMYAQTLARYRIKDLIVFDIHSYDAGTIIMNASGCKTMHYLMPNDVLGPAPFGNDFDAIVVPDEGARGRAMAFGDHLYPDLPLVFCDKRRDPETGRLSNYRILNEEIGGVRNFLVIDDICDGGGTFNLLAQSIGERIPDSVLTLFVSHGVFSKGLSNLDNRYTEIWATDSLYTRDYRGPDWAHTPERYLRKLHLNPEAIWQLIHERNETPVPTDSHRLARRV